MADPKPLSHGEPSNPSVFEQINSICQSFVKETSAAEAKPAEDCFLDYVKQLDGGAQPTLVRNILHNEIERRRKEGKQPRPDDFLGALPGLEVLVHQVFQESAALSKAVSTHKPPKDGLAQTVDYAPLTARFLGEFELLGKLGQGGMGEVFEARHLTRGDHVALKMVRVKPEEGHDTLEEADRLHRFKREFRALADINDRHLVGLHALEEDGGQYFFTMDLIDGDDFLSYVRPDKQLDKERLRSALAQLIAGVMALHHHKIVHRDLKPTNVMVDRDGQVKILDFGLVVDLAQNVGATTTVHFHGTPAYAAPEQAVGRQTYASDWYAVGVMLHEALVGRLPFRGAAMQILKEKQKRDADSIVGWPDIPEDLAQLCMGLLSRDPGQRLQAPEIAKVVSAEVVPSKPVAKTEHPLIGREEQLAALQDAHQFLWEQKEPLMVFVSGLSGEGKTYLVQHFLAPLRKDKAQTILSGRCYDRESVPFKALDRLMDVLCSYLESLPESKAALLMPSDISFLTHLFPVMKRVGVVAQASSVRVSNLDQQQVRQRAYAALRDLFLRLSRQTPLVMFIDDLQWGDADSSEVMFQVLRPPEAPAVLFLGSFRTDEAKNSPFLGAWNDLQRKNNTELPLRLVQVGPLSAEECEELVVKETGEGSQRIHSQARQLFEQAGGNPFLLTELIDSFDQQSGELRQTPLHEMIQRKLGNLPQQAQRLLDIIAVSGQALSVAEASKSVGHDSPAISTITHMRTEKLVRLVGSDENPQVDTYHDKIRETVIGGMGPQDRAATHLVLAKTIEDETGKELQELAASLESEEAPDDVMDRAHPRVYDLAYHFDGAGEKNQAWRYAILAAEQARRQFAPEVAAQQFAIAKRNAEGVSNGVRYRIAEGFGESLMLLGRYEEANDQLDGAIDLVDDVQRKAVIEVLQGQIAFKQGLMDKSMELHEGGLRRLGVWVPRSQFGIFCGLIRELCVQVMHNLLPFLRHRKQRSGRFELIIHFFNHLQAPYVFSKSTFRMLWDILAGLNRAELVPPSPELAFSYSLQGMMMSMVGWQRLGARYGNRSTELARSFNDLSGLGYSCMFTGIGLYASARYEEGLKHLSEAMGAFDKAGDLWSLHLTRFHKACCHFGLGNLVEAITDASETFASSARLADSRMFCSSYLLARATRGDIPFEELKCCYPNRPDDVMSTAHGVMAEGHWHTFHGRTEEALQAFERAREMIRRSFCVNSHMIVVLPELAAALRRHADAIQYQDGNQSQQMRRRSHRLSKWATRITRLFPAAYPLALRERSLILATVGKTKKALKFADKSCAVAQKQNAKYEYAQSLLERAKLAQQLDLPEAEEQLQSAKTELAKFEETIRKAGEQSALPPTADSLAVES